MSQAARVRVLVSVVFVAAAACFGAQRQPPPPPSPEVLSDGKVVFRIQAPKAAEVLLRGDWLSEAAKLTKDETGLWSITLEKVEPELYTYSFSVDGVKVIDPRNPSIKPGIAGSDSLLFVAGGAADFQDNKAVPHGQVRQVWYSSSTLKMQRRMHVYTPPGYDGSTAKYPVLYLLHGGGDDDAGWSTVGRAGFIMDNLLAAGKAKPMVIVMPNGSMPRAANETGGGGMQDRFGLELIDDVMPVVEGTFRVGTRPEMRAIAGLSMGGGQTLRVLTKYPGLFSHWAIWSAGVGGPNSPAATWEENNKDFLGKAESLNGRMKLIQIKVGDKDFSLAGSKALDEALTKHKLAHKLEVTGGGHTWLNWRQYLNGMLPQLFATPDAK